MVETKNNEFSTQGELEPAPKYAVGDVVRISVDDGELDPRLWLITTPEKNTPTGLEMGRIQIDEDGKALGADGTIDVDSIVEKVGSRKTPEEVIKISMDAFEAQYGDTVPTEVVLEMIVRNAGFDTKDE